MKNELLHVFRNTPFGREMLMQSAYFCQQIGVALSIYIAEHSQFLMYFEADVVTVDLDRSFLRSPDSARERASEIASAFSIQHRFYEPTRSSAVNLPDLSSDFSYMCCPRTISDLSSKIGLGHIGSRVRAIARNARFPVLVPAAAYKPWRSVVCCYGGSANARIALRCARKLSGLSEAPLLIFTQAEETREFYEAGLQRESILDSIEGGRVGWLYCDGGDLRENLFAIPHDALIVIGAYGHGVAKDLLFGSKMETIQTEMPNPLVIVGPACPI